MVELNYKKMGEGPPMIILHGLMGSLDNWQTLAKQFSETHAVYIVDQRNHGQSPHVNEMSYSLMAQDLLDFMNEHEISKPVLIGHSMGGKTVMEFALTHPDLLDKLVVVDISPRKYPVHHDEILNALKEVDFNVLKGRKEVEEFLMDRLKERGVVLFLTKNIYWKNDGELAFRFNLDVIDRTIKEISDWPPHEEIYNQNCLFIRGGNSNYVRDEEVELFRQFPEAEIQTIAGAGHWVHAEKPQEFFGTVMSCIERG